jgi:D-3-phosphoglycerate dehydrogenase
LIRLGARLGHFLSQIAAKRCDTLNVNYSGKNEADMTPVARAVIRGFLAAAGGDMVNEVNALTYAADLGLRITESREGSGSEFTELLELTATGEGGWVSVGGTFFGSAPRIVKINGRFVEARPEGVLLVFENTDRPGVVGRVGSLMGQHGINIAAMSLSRNDMGGRAVTVLNLDSRPAQTVLDALVAEGDISNVQVVTL